MGTFQGNMPNLDGIGAGSVQVGPKPDRLWCPDDRSAPRRGTRPVHAGPPDAGHSSPRALSTTLFTPHSPMPTATRIPART